VAGTAATRTTDARRGFRARKGERGLRKALEKDESTWRESAGRRCFAN
jgi:hypothetical protein